MTRIVVGVDDSEHASDAVRWACSEARYWDDVELVILHAWHYPYRNRRSGRRDLREEMEADAREALDALVAEARAGGGDGVRVTATLVEQSPVEALVDAGRQADLLVLGSRGRGGLTQALLGSVSHKVAQHAPCPVAIVRHDEHVASPDH